MHALNDNEAKKLGFWRYWSKENMLLATMKQKYVLQMLQYLQKRDDFGKDKQ